MKTKSAAVLTVHDAPKMSTKGRKAIVTWLMQQASFLDSNHKEMSSRYNARYLYEPRRPKIDLRKPKERRAIEALIGVAMRKET